MGRFQSNGTRQRGRNANRTRSVRPECENCGAFDQADSRTTAGTPRYPVNGGVPGVARRAPV